MNDPLLLGLVASSSLVVALVVVLRGKAFGTFTAVLLTLHTGTVAGLWEPLRPFLPVVLWLHGALLLHLLALVRPRLRSKLYRALLSVPAHAALAGSMLAFPWAVAAALGLPPYGWWLPYVIAALSIPGSLRARQEVVDLVLDGDDVSTLRRVSAVRRRREPEVPGERALRLVQITDPHLGPFMSEERLRGICARAVAADPDLVLLTGDFFTMEGKGSAGVLARALAPLLPLSGRTFACHGNHDLEAPTDVREGLEGAGVRLLRDEVVRVETAVGAVQIVGLEHVFFGRKDRYAGVFAELPPQGDALRLVLLHDPGGFRHLPLGEADLVLSGHTHGGHVGLVSLGLNWTSIGGLLSMPDHGFWGRGRDRLYVHRANGHYGFPLRVGVPAEESLLRVFRPGRDRVVLADAPPAPPRPSSSTT